METGEAEREVQVERRLSRRQFLRGFGLGVVGTMAGGGALGSYGHYVEPRFLDVSHVSIRFPRLPAAFHGATFALLTDLHIATSPDNGYLQSVVDRALQASPSLIALGGDYVSTRGAEERELLQSLVSRLRAPLGVYAILGNHDYRRGSVSIVDVLQHGGVTVLQNSHVAIRRDGQTIYLAGLGDALQEQDDLAATLDGLSPADCTLLLAHEPDLADDVASDGRVALQLSGHSHAGQIRIPGLPRYFPRLGRKYPEGLRQVGSLRLYTSRGIGEIGIPLRINCPPELPIITLLAE